MNTNIYEFFINKIYCGNDIDLSFVSPITARKFSKLDKLALSAMNKCREDNTAPNLVFGSIHGQFDRLSKLTEQFITENEVSPIGFSSSVHNNTVGVYSLLTKNNSPYTAISTGEQTVSSSFCEAVMQLKENDNVLMCCAESYKDFNYAIAILFSNKKTNNSIKIKMTVPYTEAPISDPDEYLRFEKFLTDKNIQKIDTTFYRLEKVC